MIFTKKQKNEESNLKYYIFKISTFLAVQESGVPNVTGYTDLAAKVWWASGIIKYHGSENDGVGGGGYGPEGFDIDLSISSNQYQSINEVRVKSIISIGFIKLY